MNKFPEKLSEKLAVRQASNSLRKLNVLEGEVDFYSNDYIGFSREESISKNAVQELEAIQAKNGSTGSRLISGTHNLHLEVENQIANFHNAQAALLFNSGYDANVGLFSALLQKGDVVLFDELIHASVRDGIQMSYAKSYKFKHNDVEDLEGKLQRFSTDGVNVYIAIESVYSMDGDTAPLEQITILSNKYSAYLIVDEAHSNAVFGDKGIGLVSQLQLEAKVFARVHTFGKALGCHGAVVLGTNQLKEFLINFSRSFIYTTAIPLHNVATIKWAYRALENSSSIDRLKDNIRWFKDLVTKHRLEEIFIESNSAIHCCIVPGNDKVKFIAKQMITSGFAIKPILSPTVKSGEERLRICLHSYNTKEEITNLIVTLSNLLLHS